MPFVQVAPQLRDAKAQRLGLLETDDSGLFGGGGANGLGNECTGVHARSLVRHGLGAGGWRAAGNTIPRTDST